MALSQDGKLVIPGHISKFDLATPDDLLFSYLLAAPFLNPRMLGNGAF